MFGLGGPYGPRKRFWRPNNFAGDDAAVTTRPGDFPQETDRPRVASGLPDGWEPLGRLAAREWGFDEETAKARGVWGAIEGWEPLPDIPIADVSEWFASELILARERKAVVEGWEPLARLALGDLAFDVGAFGGRGRGAVAEWWEPLARLALGGLAFDVVVGRTRDAAEGIEGWGPLGNILAPTFPGIESEFIVARAERAPHPEGWEPLPPFAVPFNPYPLPGGGQWKYHNEAVEIVEPDFGIKDGEYLTLEETILRGEESRRTIVYNFASDIPERSRAKLIALLELANKRGHVVNRSDAVFLREQGTLAVWKPREKTSLVPLAKMGALAGLRVGIRMGKVMLLDTRFAEDDGGILLFAGLGWGLGIGLLMHKKR